MSGYRVIFTPAALEQVAALYAYIEVAASPRIAEQYTNAIIDYCESFKDFPHRGTCRDDVRPGLRITNYKKRTVIAFSIEDGQVSIINIFYGGQNYEATLQQSDLDG